MKETCDLSDRKEGKLILPYRSEAGSARMRHPWLTITLSAGLLVGMVAAFGTAPDTDVLQVDKQRIVESLVAEPVVASNHISEDEFVREERIRSGDSVPALLGRLGIDDPATLDFLRSDKSAQTIFRQLSPGKTVTARITRTGKLVDLHFPLNGVPDRALTITQTPSGKLDSKLDTLKLETRIVMKSAEIRYSLFGATDAAGIPDGIATQLADIFGGDIDFHRDLRKGDRFAVVYESITHLGKEIRSGKLLASEFINNGRSYQAAWFPSNGSEGGYYSAEGKSLRKAFLRSPLEFSRITSSFSTARFHPVLQKWRAHKGIDYGAPTGTRVRATGNGSIEFIGTRGGYGKVVILRHQGRYNTLYAHLSGFASNLRPGSRVSQGDTIGYVGATGLASGPHLHYEFQINGVHQNPLAMALPSAPPLTAQQLPEFRRYVASHFAHIDRIRNEETKLALVD